MAARGRKGGGAPKTNDTNSEFINISRALDTREIDLSVMFSEEC